MDESRQLLAGASAVLRKRVPPPALCGFLLLLALMFAVSYAVGAAYGPVAPGMPGTRTGSGGGGTVPHSDSGGMGGMSGMHG
ncbi:hypothetical protein AB0N14_05265 [Streptomyces sp. NPDC051104]|uniref:hypothetical protein n=1 Tax=Streptomyces sp. NPDC051104 TaxID=3155044 RepID=UPI003420B75B